MWNDELTLRTFAALVDRRVADLPSWLGPIIALTPKRGGGALSLLPYQRRLRISLARRSPTSYDRPLLQRELYY